MYTTKVVVLFIEMHPQAGILSRTEGESSGVASQVGAWCARGLVLKSDGPHVVIQGVQSSVRGKVFCSFRAAVLIKDGAGRGAGLGDLPATLMFRESPDGARERQDRQAGRRGSGTETPREVRRLDRYQSTGPDERSGPRSGGPIKDATIVQFASVRDMRSLHEELMPAEASESEGERVSTDLQAILRLLQVRPGTSRESHRG
jgi:hypothetical protein